MLYCKLANIDYRDETRFADLGETENGTPIEVYREVMEADLKPFSVKVKIFDPYVDRASLGRYQEAEICSLEEALSWGEIISIHASLTPETYHMIDADRLKLVQDGALLVNYGQRCDN